MSIFKRGTGDWKQYRKLQPLIEVDFHYEDDEYREGSYSEAMAEIRHRAFEALKKAQHKGIRYVLFTHGWSTSRPGNATARSEIRGLMRSKEATPYIIRKECIQHAAVFVAIIRAIRKVGQLLIETKQALSHGQFEEMVRVQLPFSESTSRRLMSIASDKRISNRAHAHVLPNSWYTLYEITKLNDDKFQTASRSRETATHRLDRYV